MGILTAALQIQGRRSDVGPAPQSHVLGAESRLAFAARLLCVAMVFCKEGWPRGTGNAANPSQQPLHTAARPPARLPPLPPAPMQGCRRPRVCCCKPQALRPEHMSERFERDEAGSVNTSRPAAAPTRRRPLSRRGARPHPWSTPLPRGFRSLHSLEAGSGQQCGEKNRGYDGSSRGRAAAGTGNSGGGGERARYRATQLQSARARVQGRALTAGQPPWRRRLPRPPPSCPPPPRCPAAC